ncbi:MAG: NosD domain-containing protein, partial [Candidatus Hodarchaeota archaeon]
GNIANSNKDDGINIYRSNYNIITKNNVNRNSDGIYLNRCSKNIITKNIVNNNTVGISFYSSSYNTISNNILIGNNDCFTENENCFENIFENNNCG